MKEGSKAIAATMGAAVFGAAYAELSKEAATRHQVASHQADQFAPAQTPLAIRGAYIVIERVENGEKVSQPVLQAAEHTIATQGLHDKVADLVDSNHTLTQIEQGGAIASLALTLALGVIALDKGAHVLMARGKKRSFS